MCIYALPMDTDNWVVKASGGTRSQWRKAMGEKEGTYVILSMIKILKSYISLMLLYVLEVLNVHKLLYAK